MRKNLLIAGLVILVIGVALVGIAFYYIPRTLGPLLNSVNKTMLGPPASLGVGGSINISETITKAPALVILLYNDSIGKPLSVIGTPSQSESVSGMYILSFVSDTNSTLTMGLVNNYSSPVVVRYGYSEIPASSLAGATPFILMLFIGGGVFIVGLIVAVIGALMKPRQRQSPSDQAN
ncbi:hypothetical protein GCM10007981_14360 [Thermocladium modestius]|uniref:Uncharacterized protein n=1 Tax=Thermocladium modestius TaxID=62609 RepID=A0A830GWC9_9CREN|nr:hypothetical protein [Thermocladium modestius]GGP21658.1 hypothetical protein GCM10007981_14360 [Thermocladium modestius]